MRIIGVLVCGVALGAVGCSSSSDTPAGGGGAGGDAAGGGPANLPAQAGLSITFTEPTPQIRMTCPVANRDYQLGNPKAPSLLDPGQSVPDGSAGANISCSVTGNPPNGPYRFGASIQGETSTGDLITLLLTYGTLDTTYKGNVNVSVVNSQLGNTFSNPMPCNVQAINSQAKAGSLWAEFECGEVTAPPLGDCAISGEFVLENCAGS